MDIAAAAAKLLQSCPILCDPIDGSPSGSSVHGILQARILEWVAIPFSRNGTQVFPTQEWNLDLLHCRQILYHLSHQGSPEIEAESKKTNKDNCKNPAHPFSYIF